MSRTELQLRTTSASYFALNTAALFPIVFQDGASDVVVEYIDLCLCKIPSTHASLKEKIKFRKSPTGWLRYTEEGVDDTEKADPGLSLLLAYLWHVYLESLLVGLTQKKPA